ncbi:MAG: aminopeptidase P N-terminal domain-containing protein [Chitinophagales bacterium]|nr:aminopeptidase P N-terminal domain-containing protein [Chitinophagales bacterium]MDW8428672.1 aminopeptidase P N-terminal domain-containing protein [Chitinophagales bacterium]
MRYTLNHAELFTANRQRLKTLLPPNALVLLLSNDVYPRSADGHYPFRQDPDLFYLTGIDQEDTYLLLYPDCPREDLREVLFLRRTSETIAIWEGPRLTQSEACARSGIKTIKWNDEFDSIVNIVMCYAEQVFLNLNEHDRLVNEVPYRSLRFARALQDRFPLHQYRRLAPLMHQLRSIKMPQELELIKKAIAITEKAFRRVLQFIRPGVMEYEIEAEITHEFLRNGASGHAYQPIIASGKNACILHYINNNQPCRDGELVLMDFGAEYANYVADLSRTVPVNGRFTPRQREVYDAVLRVMRQAKNLLRPGTNLHEYNTKLVGQIMEEELLKLGLLKTEEVKNQDPENPAYKKYFMHGTSHYLGLDVHDVGSRFATIQPGMVFTCEPGIYIPEEGFGIRLENNILVTEDEPVDLMAGIPIEAEEIEALMAARPS